VEFICPDEATAKQWYVHFTQVATNGELTLTTSLPGKRKILAFLNPFGGRGLAPRIWEHALTILELGHVSITLRHTEYQNHAKEIVSDQIKPGQYDGIITISGDGLIHEIINGIMSRPDH